MTPIELRPKPVEQKTLTGIQMGVDKLWLDFADGNGHIGLQPKPTPVPLIVNTLRRDSIEGQHVESTNPDVVWTLKLIKGRNDEAREETESRLRLPKGSANYKSIRLVTNSIEMNNAPAEQSRLKESEILLAKDDVDLIMRGDKMDFRPKLLENPPYENPLAKSDKFYVKMVKSGLELMGDSSSFVTPSHLFTSILSTFREFRELIDGKYIVEYIDFSSGLYFTDKNKRGDQNSVGERICSYKIRRMKPGETHPPIEIIDVMGNVTYEEWSVGGVALEPDKKFAARIMSEYAEFSSARMNTASRFGSDSYKKRDTTSTEPREGYTPVVDIHNTVFWTSEDVSADQGPKIIFNRSGQYHHPKYPGQFVWKDDVAIAANNTQQLMLENELQREHAYNYFTSKFCLAFVKSYNRGSAAFLGTAIQQLPSVDFNEDWNDEKIYNHFNITEEERELIESIWDNRLNNELKKGTETSLKKRAAY